MPVVQTYYTLSDYSSQPDGWAVLLTTVATHLNAGPGQSPGRDGLDQAGVRVLLAVRWPAASKTWAPAWMPFAAVTAVTTWGPVRGARSR